MKRIDKILIGVLGRACERMPNDPKMEWFQKWIDTCGLPPEEKKKSIIEAYYAGFLSEPRDVTILLNYLCLSDK